MDELSLLSLLRFADFSRRPDDHLDLVEGCLLVAGVAYPGLNHGVYSRRLDALCDAVRVELDMRDGQTLPTDSTDRRETAERVLVALRDVLARREGFAGNQDDYYDPRNSFLNEVLDRRTGIPISLSAVYVAVAQRLGAPLTGANLPAHFVAKWPLPRKEGGAVFVDAFGGGTLMDEPECLNFVLRLISAPSGIPRVDPHWFDAVNARTFLTRMLHNLKLIYLNRGETGNALGVVERLVMLRPDLTQELRDRGLLRLAMGETLLASADVATYAALEPDAPDMPRLRRRLMALGEIRNKLN
jgi:regulator of sirC expression with transglutaminase-like and TPR domain